MNTHDAHPAITTTFAGVDGWTDARPPNWYARSHEAHNPDPFEAICPLQGAVETEVASRLGPRRTPAPASGAGPLLGESGLEDNPVNNRSSNGGNSTPFVA